MLDWKDYIAQLVNQSSSLDGISLSLGDLSKPVGIPPMIKASILMLDRMQEHQGKFNIFVFPERIQSIFIFTLSKLFYNIAEGRIESAYDPEKFQPGEHLKLGNAVVEFLRIEERYGKKHIVLRLADLETSAPIEYFPLFQKTTAKVLSKDAKFSEAKRAAKALLPNMSGEKKYLKLLTDHKTHMDSSIINMTTIINTKEQINSCELFGHSVKDLLLIGQADYEGNVRNVGAGQLGGIPAIVLASDLYTIAETARKGHPIQSIIIDGSNANMLLSQLDALDDLMRLGVPITCVTDIVNSFDLQPFIDRCFNVWRWDETSITDQLYDIIPLASDRKTKHCARQEVEHLVSDGNEISVAIKMLSAHKNNVQDGSAQLLKMFDHLYGLAFTAIREIVPFEENLLMQTKQVLEKCRIILEQEKNFIPPQMYADFKKVADCLATVFTRGYVLPKHDALCKRLQSENYNSIRELGQAATWIRADIDQHLDVMYKRRFTEKRYPTKEEYRKSRRYIWRDEELTSRISGSDVTASLANLGIRYPGEEDAEGKIKEHPIDICLATNMISVGLDVSRLGLMTVAGQPKTTSEYIQATSRVGRNAEKAPGLVFVLYRPGRPRDKSHYEHFKSYHSRVYCNVEPTSVTPFSAPVRERALHAIMVGMMRLESGDSFNADPPKYPDEDLIERVRSIIENRVDDIDSEELDATLDRMEYVLQRWEDWNPRKWEPAKNSDWSYADPVPLMYSAGSHPNEAWGKRGIETPTSMRNVDASCEAEVLKNRYSPKEG